MTNSLALATTTYHRLFLVCDNPRQRRFAERLAAALVWVWAALLVLDQMAADLEEWALLAGELVEAGMIGVEPWLSLGGCLIRAVWWGVVG